MSTPEADQQSSGQRARDEQIATEPPLPPFDLPPGVTPPRMEAHLARQRHPLAVPSIAENGFVRPLDPSVTLPESSRVIIVATGEA